MTTLYIPAPRRLNVIKDSDFVYNFQLMKLANYDPDLHISVARSLQLDVRTYTCRALELMRRRYKLPVPRKWGWELSQYYRMPSTGEELSRSDAILAFERYPDNANLPVIWITGPTDIQKLRSRGLSERAIQQEIHFKREVNARAAATILTTQGKKDMFDEVIRPSKPTQMIPFFQPIDSIAPSRFTAKWNNLSPLKLLFIGRAANRKGLPFVLDAYSTLLKRYPGRISLHIVSSLSDGPVEIPNLPGLVYDARAPHARAIELMAEAHYLVMPAELESYGWVYVEAMAQGAIPVAADFAVQRELLDEGRAGWLVERSARGVAAAITRGIEQPESAKKLAFAAFDFWKNRYAPGLVAGQIAAVAHSVANQVTTLSPIRVE